MPQFKDTWGGQLGMAVAQNAGTGFLGGLMGQLFAKSNDKRQIRQQQKLQDMQIAGTKQLTDYNYQKELDMWKATSYPGQIEMMKQAGLNPALLYGKGGGGGTTIGTPAGAIGMATAQQNPGEATAGMGMMMQHGMTAAQMDLIRAQAENVRADTANKQGVIPENISAQTADLLQGIENKKSQQQLTEIQSLLAQLALTKNSATLSDEIDEVMYRVKILRNDKTISDATVDSKIEIIANEALNVVYKNALTIAQTNETFKNIELKDEQIKQITASISQAWRALDQNDSRLAIDKFKAEMEAQYPGITKTLGRVFDDAINSLFKLTKTQRIPHNKMK